MVPANKQERFLKAKTVETGLPDFHKMVVPVFKITLKKQKPKIVPYRDCKLLIKETQRKSHNLFQYEEKYIIWCILKFSFAYLRQNGTNITKTY